MENYNSGHNQTDGCNAAALKYGDADLVSKRRKLSTVTEVWKEELEQCPEKYYHQSSAADDEYQNFVKIIDNYDLNSSICDNTLDFKGGLLSSSKNTINTTSPPYTNNILVDGLYEQPASSNVDCELFITTQPSLTSKGFENTFKLLKSHVVNNCLKTKNALERLNTIQLENVSLMSTASSNSLLLNTLQGSITPEEQPTLFELELEAMQRMRNMVNNAQCNNKVGKCDKLVATPMLELLYNFVAKGLKSGTANKRNDLNEESICTCYEDGDTMQTGFATAARTRQHLMYYAAKTVNGTNCLKIVKNLLTSDRVLCGNRVSQMTRAYDDIEAVTRLLEEKEKDLELTVQIGKELLTQNNSLENRICELEADLKSTNDDRAQLLHELHKKNELIAVLTNDSDDGTEGDTPTLSKSITHDLLQKKIASLENENKSLKMEACQLACETDEVEAHERQLVEDITAQLNEANSQFDHLSLELERQREENRLQHEQIVSLTARLAEAEMRLHQLTHDNEEHLSLLNITKENQNSLALELVEFKQRYQEVLNLLQETQDQLRKQRKKQLPQARSSFMSNIPPPESLQCELMESSMFSENSLDSGISADTQHMNDRIGRLMSQVPGVYGGSGVAGMTSSMFSSVAGGGLPPYKRVFETVRCASKNGNYADSGDVSLSQIGAMSMSSGAMGPRMSASYAGYVGGVHPAGSYYHDSGNGMGGKTYSSESLATQSDDDNYPAQPVGVPGAPGAKELEAALKRLTPAEVLARRAMLSHAPLGTYSYDEQHHTTKELPLGLRTPDSIMSTGSSGVSSTFMNLSSSTSNQWRLPEKLQIVKPIEGSQTLHHWSRLATPTLSGLLEERPGVSVRGGRGLDDLGMHVYTLSDVEEDITEELPGKQYMTQGCTYTYTTSTVMHPDDGLMTDLSFLSQSQMSSRMASTSTSRQPSCPPTPRAGLSRKNSCSTFSVNLGLASMLNERGIKAVTPSALNTPAGPNFSPTVTPCNSPEGSPTRSMSPEPLFGLLSSGADLIRRKLVGGDIGRRNRNQQTKQQQQRQQIMLSRLERRALRSLKLMEKVESIGLENIIATQPNTVGVANRSSSPMTQYSNLKSLHSSTNSIVDDLHFGRDQIKDVLNKGLQTQKGAIASNSKGTSSDNKCDNTRSDIRNQTTVVAKTNSDRSDTPHQPKKVVVEPSTTGPTALPSASETRLKQMQRQKSRRNLKNGMAGQRPDLGTIGGNSGSTSRMRCDLGKVGSATTTHSSTKQDIHNGASSSNYIQKIRAANTRQQMAESEQRVEQSLTQSFVGTVSTLLFGRKGGWL